jgi:hypothetical protein
MLIAVSCAGTGATDTNAPTAPAVTQAVESQDSGHYLWAYYQVFFDPEKSEMGLLPVRDIESHWNVLNFLEKGPCTNCVSIGPDIITTPQGTRIYHVQVAHPFTPMNFSGFDVRGIAMFTGSHTFPVSGLTTPDRYAGDGALVNADGFTTLYNATTAGSGPDGLQGYIKGKFTPPQTPNARLNGYRRFISDLPGNTRNVFYAGDAVTVDFELDMPDSAFVFGYAVDASWATPSVKPVNNPITDFPPQANCSEPWKITVTEEPIGQGLHDQGGSTKLLIDVYDWQGKSSYFAPVIESPELFGGTAIAIWKEDTSDHTRYEVTIDNEKIAPQGTYKCLVSVEDTDNATSPGWLDLTAYQIIELDVGEYQTQANQAPTAAAYADDYDVMVGDSVYLHDDSTDPDGYDDILYWRWDVSFDPVDGFQPGFFVKDPEVIYSNPGTYKVMLEVEDSAGHTDMLDNWLTINVQGAANEPPIACGVATNIPGTHVNINNMVQFEDCSVDPDGYSDIVQFKWDLDGDGTYEKPGSNATKIYTQGGDVNVQHWVRDSANNEDELDDPVLIEVNGPPVADAEASGYDVNIGDLITLTNLSTDPDGNGDIVDVYWDINGNGEYDDAEDIQDNDNPQIFFYDAGLHQIGLKVVDEWALEDTLDPKLQINVQGIDPFCIDLIDQYNSADHLYGTRSFYYYNAGINGLGGLNYQDPDGPWDFTVVPASAPAICKWLLPTDPDVPSGAKSEWPLADFFFKEDSPTSGGSQYVPHIFDFVDAENGDLIMEGQYQGGNIFTYGDTFYITHPICHPWYDSGSGTGEFVGIGFDISWDMQTLGIGPALFFVNGEPTLLPCMLIRHHMSFVDTEFGYLSFSLLNYQWIDIDGNEVAFMQADNGLNGTNFSGNTYTGTVICRSLTTIS